MVLNSLSFCLSVKLLISPSYLNEILAGYSNLGCRLFSFITLSMSCHSFLAWRVSIERSAVILMGIPLCVICCFSLAAFNICSLCLISLGFLDLGGYFLPHFREFFNYCLLKYFLMVFLFVFFFWDSCDSNIGAFNIVQRSLRFSSFITLSMSYHSLLSQRVSIETSAVILMGIHFCVIFCFSLLIF